MRARLTQLVLLGVLLAWAIAGTASIFQNFP